MRQGNFRAASDTYREALYPGPFGSASRWPVGASEPYRKQRAEVIGARRKELHLPRSLSDQTNAVFDEHVGEDPTHLEHRNRGQNKHIEEAWGRRGQPSEETQAIKHQALHRAHSIGYPGEVSSDNEATRHVDSLRQYLTMSPAAI